jgi:8-oxo-dGTP diphosphatase
VKRVTHVVAGVAVKDGSVFLARRCANDTLGGMWEFPGGKIERGKALPRPLRVNFSKSLEPRFELVTTLETVFTNIHTEASACQRTG